MYTVARPRRCCIETAERIELIFGTEATLVLYYALWCTREYGYLQKTRALPVGTVRSTLNVAAIFLRFVTAYVDCRVLSV